MAGRALVRIVVVVWLLDLVSTVAVVIASHRCRQLYAELARLQQEENRLQVEWGQYLLEQSSWASLGRIEQLAQEKLEMYVPEIDTIVLVKP